MQDDIAQLTHPALSVCEMREVLPITILPESCVVFCGEAARLVVVAYWQDICRRAALPINADTPAASSLLLAYITLPSPTSTHDRLCQKHWLVRAKAGKWWGIGAWAHVTRGLVWLPHKGTSH